jgi:enhanced entry protein EnhC
MNLRGKWHYAVLALIINPAFGQTDYDAYRLGNYKKTMENFVDNVDKTGVSDYYRGRLSLYGYATLKNENLGLRYIEMSAQKGYLPAQQFMARVALFKEQDLEKAFAWFKKASAAGDMQATMYVASAYLYGVGVKKNEDLARKYYIEAAKNGDAIAQYTLAQHFLESRQLSNKKLGLIWLNKAVNAENPRALTRLAQLSLQGQIVPKDPELAQKLLNQVLSKNFLPAMLVMGQMEIEKGDYQAAFNWFKKAADAGSNKAEFQLAELYLLEKNPMRDPKTGFMWMLKSAQAGYEKAQLALAKLYEKGIGVESSEHLAKEWTQQAKASASNATKMAQAARWLTNGSASTLNNTPYQLGGILGAWTNTNVLTDSGYNHPPQRTTFTRKQLFQPNFAMITPTDVPINAYFDALQQYTQETSKGQTWVYPGYPLNSDVEALLKANSPVLRHPTEPGPYQESYYLEVEEPTFDGLAFTDEQIQLSRIVDELEQKAVLGDGDAQFDLAQLLQAGIGANQDENRAISLYLDAIEQQHVGAEYALGVLYLKQKNPEADARGRALLLSAAFKGNKYAQYVSSMMDDSSENTKLTEAEKEQARSMQYLAAANGYAKAEYALAEHLAREQVSDVSVEAQNARNVTIRTLYARAAEQGVAEAFLPLAFYNAMDADKNKQAAAFSQALKQAELGNSKAALLAGLLYDRGIGVAPDAEKAIYWYQQAGSNPVSQFILGTYTSLGKGLPLNKDEGRALLEQSASQHFSYALLNLGVSEQQRGQAFQPALIQSYALGNSTAGLLLADYYLSASNDKANMQNAHDIYYKLAKMGDQYAQMKLGYLQENGLGVTKDLAAAEHWYNASAEQGNPKSQYLLGQFYEMGQSGNPDYTKAIAWYKKSAVHLPEADVALGFLYETVYDDYARAKQYYEQAARQKNTLGIYDLALLKEYGKGMKQDFEAARVLYQSASDVGFVPAMTQLAGLYSQGLGGKRDDTLALELYNKAAEKGNSTALYQLGLMAEAGIASKIDFEQAKVYYEKAAHEGNEKAMLALARMYYYGLGVDKNPEQAMQYYQKLALRNNAYAQLQLAKQYLNKGELENLPPKGQGLLQQARENGSIEAALLLRRIEARTKSQVSFIEPVFVKETLSSTKEPADILYFNALSAWNSGDEKTFRRALRQLKETYPSYVPAKKAYEELSFHNLTRM